MQQIIEKIEQYSASELNELSAALAQIEQKRANKKTAEELFGAWADMDDDLFRELTDGTYKMRMEDDISQHTSTQ